LERGRADRYQEARPGPTVLVDDDLRSEERLAAQDAIDPDPQCAFQAFALRRLEIGSFLLLLGAEFGIDDADAECRHLSLSDGGPERSVT